MSSGYVESQFFIAKIEKTRGELSVWPEAYAICRKDDGSFVEWHCIKRDMGRSLRARMAALDAQEAAAQTHTPEDHREGGEA